MMRAVSRLKSVPGLKGAFLRGKTGAERIRHLLEKRKRIAHHGKVETAEHSGLVEALRRDGIVIIRQAVEKEALAAVRAEFEAHLDAGTKLLRISKDSDRKPGDFSGADAFLSPEEVMLGQSYFRKHTNFAALGDPMLNAPSMLPLVFRESLVRIAAEYFGCVPALGSMNLRKSFANDIGDFDTLYFHCDENCPDFLKYFLYLNDVDREGGPFCYVKASHRKKFRGWRSKYRWTHEEIASRYPAEDILYNTAQAGDLIIANTTGFHRGTKVISRDRSMLTLDYVVHEEYWGKTPKFKIRRADLARLSSSQKPIADYLAPVD